MHRDSKLWKKKWNHLVRSACWGRHLGFPWILLERGQHLLLAVSEITPGLVVFSVPDVRCTKIPVPEQEHEEIRGGSAAHAEGDGRKWEGDEKLDSRADSAGGQSHRGDERVQAGWGESWQHSGLQGEPCSPPCIPFSLNFYCFILTWKFILTCFRKKIYTRSHQRNCWVFKSCLNIKFFQLCGILVSHLNLIGRRKTRMAEMLSNKSKIWCLSLIS